MKLKDSTERYGSRRKKIAVDVFLLKLSVENVAEVFPRRLIFVYEVRRQMLVYDNWRFVWHSATIVKRKARQKDVATELFSSQHFKQNGYNCQKYGRFPDHWIFVLIFFQ